MRKSYDSAAVEVVGAVATITLTRPKSGNALSAQAGRDLRAILVSLSTTPDLRLLVLRAEGRAFCVGGDLADFNNPAPLAPRVCDMVADYHTVCSLLAGLDVPVLCVVQGPVAGAGLALMLLADYSIAARAATFTYAYPSVGFSSDGGLTWLLPRALGLQRFRSFATAGQTLTAGQAVEWGLLCEAVDDDALSDRATALIEQLANGPTRAFSAIRRLVIDGYDRSYHAHLASEMEAITKLSAGADAPAAIAAALGRQVPTFKGR